MKYSVLMSVYAKENPKYLLQSIKSMLEQTVKAEQFVIVEDGPLTTELYNVIDTYLNENPDLFTIVQLENNVGLGRALNYGIKACRNDLIARMDSDDIARLDRCEKQLEIFKKYSDISICSGTIEEFAEKIDDATKRRIVPEKHIEIIKFAKNRCPFNHPCVMYKKEAVEAVGSYKDFYLLEDYYLWIRMLEAGYKGYNIQEPLLWMRAGEAMYQRRSGKKYAQSQRQLFKYMCDRGVITYSQYIKSVVVRSASSLAPNWLRKNMFETILRG